MEDILEFVFRALLRVIGLVLQVLAELLFQGLCYFTSRLVVPLFTLGYVRVEPLSETTGSVWPRWRRWRAKPGGGKVLSADAGTLVGLVFWVGVIAVSFWAMRTLH